MLIPGGMGLNVSDLLVKIPLNPAAARRVKLRQVTNLQIGRASGAAYLLRALKYFSASIAAAQPDPAAVIACL
jgi:hypothetical protein